MKNQPSPLYELLLYCENKKYYIHFNQTEDILTIKKHAWNIKPLYIAKYVTDIFGNVDLNETAKHCLEVLKLLA